MMHIAMVSAGIAMSGNEGDTVMWTSLSRDDLRRAEHEIRQHRLDMDARHTEELKSLEANHAEERNSLESKLSRLAEIERLIDGFAQEYLQTARGDEPSETARSEAQAVAAEMIPNAAPVEVEVIATNWGKARFQSADPTVGSKPRTDWEE